MRKKVDQKNIQGMLQSNRLFEIFHHNLRIVYYSIFFHYYNKHKNKRLHPTVKRYHLKTILLEANRDLGHPLV